MKLDRSAFRKQDRQQAADHQGHYRAMAEAERGRSFLYLTQVSYGFLGKDWPRMDKSAFAKRSRQ